MAHRIAYEIRNGPITDGLMVLHSCDTPACVNPEHLFLGTHADNMADMSIKGRSCRGEKRGWAKLTAKDVVEIRGRYAKGGISQRQLAEVYRVSGSAIADIVYRRNWKHV